ncbi:MAG: CPBP family intramembrane metalloprotease [Clostridia bacterium]|nr:CPBP family intramembrane metalloprotease [Clostridia bacterium]
MEKTNIRRLVGVMMPFVIMVILQRLLLVLSGMSGMPDVIGSTLAFLAASAAGIFFFRMSCGAEALRPGTQTQPEPDGENGGKENPVVPFPVKDTLFGQLMYALAGVGVLTVTMYAVTAAVGSEPVSAFAPDTLAAEFVSLILIHPFLEEYIFRWLYYRELRPMQPIFAGLTQAVMFAIVHGSVGGMIYALFAGIVLVLITELSGSLSAAVIAHMLMNLRSFVYLTWLTEAEPMRLMPDLVLISVGFAAMLCLLVRRGLRKARAGAGETEDGGENDDD